MQLKGMKTKRKVLKPQPTESEAIVAAEREPSTPAALLVPPMPLPVDKAADLPPGDPATKPSVQ
jgi:hypothetical protein